MDSPAQGVAALDRAPRATRRADYRPPDFLIDTVELTFDLDAKATTVRSRLAVRRGPEGGRVLRLDGEALTLVSLRLDGEALSGNRYRVDERGLEIADLPNAFTLEIETRIDPSANSLLCGLYVSNGGFFTQCEAEGFRRITYFPDRPDVMARFTTTLVADKEATPVLLSNGNPEASGELPDGRHWARWVDPHPKPSYLFAVVAGDLVAVRDRFRTRSGRDVALAIWVRRGDEDRCDYAMDCLKRSMSWDEAVFGLEYDLEMFNIAAVSDFNMGAMENKGLNVFNTKYVLARPDTATDGDYLGIETVISHEYFHNWTGNRVTCRDWFQLSLKEGLTVFRDQEFSADQGSRALKRIADVRRLRAAQFPEDAGPLAHPVRPESYIEIDNFYTATVYQKGAEVVRMQHTLLGHEAFVRGMALYFLRHDNQAVEIEDFVRAMEDAGGIDLAQFRLWYSQAGTPVLRASGRHDPAARRYTLTLSQSLPGAPALLIPVRMGLLGADGGELALRLLGEADAVGTTRVLALGALTQDFVFEDVEQPPTPSLLRDFSAPVRLEGLDAGQLLFLARHDPNLFVRWESGQQYASDVLLDAVASWEEGASPVLPDDLTAILGAALAAGEADPAFAAEALALPGESVLADRMQFARPDAIHAVREAARRQAAAALAPAFRETYTRLSPNGPYRIDGAAMGQRALRNACLSYLALLGEEGLRLAAAQFDEAANMTDRLAALSVLARHDGPDRTRVLASFHAQWRDDALVLDKWFAIQAAAPRADAIETVRALYRHPDFERRNPNRLRSVVSAFADGNPSRFHAADGAGYRFLADTVIEIDPINGQTAARLVGPLCAWRRQEPERAALMRGALERIAGAPSLSRGVYEKVTKSLAGAALS